MNPSVLRWTSVSDFLRNQQDAFQVLVALHEYRPGQKFRRDQLNQKIPNIPVVTVSKVIAEGIKIGMIGCAFIRKGVWEYWMVEPPTVRKINE